MYRLVFCSELVEYLRDGSKIFRPSVQDRSDLHPDLAALLQDCWSESPEVPSESTLSQTQRRAGSADDPSRSAEHGELPESVSSRYRADLP